MVNDDIDPYQVLQVLPGSSQDAIKIAYRRLARRFHPDYAPDEASSARMIEVNKAWELIGSPVRRAAYDRAHGIIPERREEARRPSAAPEIAAAPAARAAGWREDPATWAAMSAPESRHSVDHAGPPPGRPWGSVLTFGRYAGWSLGEIARVDLDYLEWLARVPIGWQFRDQIAELAARTPRKTSTAPAPTRNRASRFSR